MLRSATAHARAYRRKLLPIRQEEFESFEAANAVADSYEAPDVVDVVSRKTRLLIDELGSQGVPTVIDRQAQQNLFVLSLPRLEPLEIVDLGGACGHGYFQMDRLLPGVIGRWHVVETPAMAAAGREHFADGRLRFFSSLADALSEMSDPTLIVASGVLQCVPRPLNTLNELLAVNAPYLYLTRTTVTRDVDRPVVTSMSTRLVDHGPGPSPADIRDRKIELAYSILPEESIRACATGSHKLRFWFDEGERTKLTLGSHGILQSMAGCLVARGSVSVA